MEFLGLALTPNGAPFVRDSLLTAVACTSGPQETTSLRYVSVTHSAHFLHIQAVAGIVVQTGMWANAQRDGRPAEYVATGDLCSTPQFR